MSNSPWAARLGLGLLLVITTGALAADLIASDLPLLLSRGGRLQFVPSLTRPPELRHETMDSLVLDLGPSDWMLSPPVPFGPFRTALDEALNPPSARHLLGTDELGRDVLARIIHGARVSLAVGFISAALLVMIGFLVGAVAGMMGGIWDIALSRFNEVMLTFPTFFLILCILGLTRVQSVWPLIAVLGFTRFPEVALLVRAEVLRLKTTDFIVAARALGGSEAGIIWRHLLPHTLGPLRVAATFGVASAILMENALSFLGFGVPPPAASWGELLTQAHQYVTHPGAWWLTLFPGLALFVTVASLHLVGESQARRVKNRARIIGA